MVPACQNVRRVEERALPAHLPTPRYDLLTLSAAILVLDLTQQERRGSVNTFWINFQGARPTELNR
jgi:hypothetical protein